MSLSVFIEMTLSAILTVWSPGPNNILLLSNASKYGVRGNLRFIDEQGARLGEGGSGHQQAAQQNHDETFFHGNSLVQSSWTGRNAWRRPYHMSFQAGFPA